MSLNSFEVSSDVEVQFTPALKSGAEDSSKVPQRMGAMKVAGGTGSLPLRPLLRGGGQNGENQVAGVHGLPASLRAAVGFFCGIEGAPSNAQLHPFAVAPVQRGVPLSVLPKCLRLMLGHELGCSPPIQC